MAQKYFRSPNAASERYALVKIDLDPEVALKALLEVEPDVDTTDTKDVHYRERGRSERPPGLRLSA